MKVICHSCEALYELPPEQMATLTPKSKLQCHNCDALISLPTEKIGCAHCQATYIVLRGKYQNEKTWKCSSCHNHNKFIHEGAADKGNETKTVEKPPLQLLQSKEQHDDSVSKTAKIKENSEKIAQQNLTASAPLTNDINLIKKHLDLIDDTLASEEMNHKNLFDKIVEQDNNQNERESSDLPQPKIREEETIVKYRESVRLREKLPKTSQGLVDETLKSQVFKKPVKHRNDKAELFVDSSDKFFEAQKETSDFFEKVDAKKFDFLGIGFGQPENSTEYEDTNPSKYLKVIVGLLGVLLLMSIVVLFYSYFETT